LRVEELGERDKGQGERAKGGGVSQDLIHPTLDGILAIDKNSDFISKKAEKRSNKKRKDKELPFPLSPQSKLN
jgi:hypothetical protein